MQGLIFQVEVLKQEKTAAKAMKWRFFKYQQQNKNTEENYQHN